MCCLFETLRGHARAGHSVEIIIPAYDLWDEGTTPLTPSSTQEFDVHVAPCAWLPTIKALRALAVRLSKGPETVYALRWLLGMITWTLLTYSLVAAALKLVYRGKRRFDMVYAHCEYASIAGYLVRLFLRIPNVTRLYGTFVAELMKKPMVWLRYPIAAGGFLVPHSLLICANDGTRGDEVARKLKVNLSRFRFWQDGVDRPKPGTVGDRDNVLRLAPHHLRKESRWILSCSRLSYWKRIDRIMRAVSVARESSCDCQLLIAGDGPESERLHGLMKELSLDEEVVWLGPVPHDEIYGLMKAVDIFIITNNVTNRCNPLFEAIRAGLPVVSVRDPSTCDLLTDGQNALLADRDDVTGLGRCLAKICSDEVLAEQMRRVQAGVSDTLWDWQERIDVEVRDLEKLLLQR